MRFVPLAEADKEAPALKFVPLGSDSQQPAAEPETPSFPVGTMGGFEEAIAPIDRRSILDRPVPMPPAPPQDELLGINPQMVRAIKAQLDAAPPEKRQAMIAKLQNRGGVYGRIASSIASQYETIDRLPEKYRFVPQDFRSEVQAARFMAREGMTPEGAQSAAISQALIQAPLELTQATPLTEAQAAGERFKFEPGMAPIEETLLAIGRVGAKGGAAILQGTGGVIRFLGDAAGMDTRDTTKTLNTLNTFTQSMGEAKYKPLQIIEDAGTSIVQQLPALVGGTITGSQPLVLGSMFITSFGQIYDDSRRRKLDIGDATARAAMFAALEVIGEKFGLGDVLKGIKASAQGRPTGELANYFARALVKEVPGEQLTYAGQFAVDKGFGLNPEAGFEEFFKGAADTLAVTLAQGGMMMGGGAAISKASQKINQIVGRPPEQSFDYEALAKAKGFLAEQAPPPERPPAAPPVEPKAPAPIVTEAAPPVQPPRTTRRVEEEEFETLPPTEVPETPPEEPVAAQPMEPPAVERTPASFAADIAAGKKLETPEDIQFYQNNAKEIEDELTKLTATEPTAPQTQTPAAAELPETPTVAPVIKPKTVEPPAPQHMDAEHPVVEIPVSDLKLSEEVPQFKYGANKKGVVQPLGGTFTKEGVAPIAVWQRLDGSLEVISGRHRFELAQRSGTKVIPSQIYYESQGFTAVDAAIKDAELNIRDEQGKVKDYVNYFKESGIDRDTAESKGFLARDKGKRGFTIANQGSDELIDALRADQVGDEAAYYIALNAPGDARLQSVGIKAIMDGKSMNVATNTMQAVKALASENDTTTDMFGFDDSAIKEAEAMARIASQKQREIQTRLSAISGAAKNPAVAKAEGIDIRNPEQVNRRIEELRAKKAAWDNWSTNPTLIAEIRAARGVEAPALAPREEPVLTTQTKEELQEKERREREIEERKRQEELEAKRKEEADKEREGFVLTGSDREADEAAARGQEDMFAAPPAAEAPSPDATVEKYVNKLTKEGNELEAYETTEDNLYRTRTFEWSGDISRKDFDALTLKAEKSDLKRGNKYSILLADTNVESSSLTFFVPSIQPTQQKISVRMQLQQTKLVEQPPAKKPPAPAPAPEAKTLPSFSKSVDELTPEEREAEVRFIRSELSTLNKKYIKSENEQEEQELEKIIDPLQERLNRLTKKGRLVEQKKKKEVSEATKVADEYETPMEVANGKTPDPALPPANRLILMPCSDMKGKTAAPAIDLYRGVFFQTLKTHAKGGKMPNVVILSAKHGIMNSNQIVEPYDQKMTPEQANILIASLDNQLRGLNIKNIDDVLIVGGKEYKKVMRLAVRKLLENGVINPGASINETTGELGEQRKQLREYMEAIQIAPVVEEKVEPVVEEKVVEEKKDYTPKQREEAQIHADETGGEIVWQKGDYALIRGYSRWSGDPVYAPTLGSRRADRDIEAFTGDQISDDIKKEMIEVKKRLEREAAIKHENKPFIVFDKGISMSKDISPEIAGVIQGWKKLLNLNVNVYVSTIDDARVNRNNFTGPHRRVGSGTLDANERGSMRRMTDGSYYILFDKSTSTTRMLEVIAHEMGHLHQVLFYDSASPQEKQALREEHIKWVEKQKGKSSRELIDSLRARTSAKTTPTPFEQRADELSSYWTLFGEWYADQTARWALSKEQPVGIVEKFFKRLGNQLRLFYQRLQNQKWLPNETFAQYIEKTIQNPIITETQIQEGRDIDKASKMSSIDESAFDFGDEKVVKEIVKRSPLDSKARSKANDVTGPVKKLTKGRSPELAAAAQQVMEGRMSKAEFDSLVNKYRPIHPFAVVPVPATEQQVFSALASNKRPFTNPEIDAGTEVGLRLDIPAFNQHNVMVVAIHEKRTPSSVGTSIGYASTAIIRNVTFGLGNQKETLRIAAGKAKDSLQTMEGKYVESTPSETYELAKEVFSNPQWIQIGFDPTRHSYFWDRRTTMPVVKADVVIQIGNFILAKNPTYATKEEFLFDIASPPTKIYQPGAEVRKATRLERIQILANLRAARTRLVKKVIAGEATIDTQRQLTALESLGKDIKQMLDMTKEPSITPEAFLSRALKAYDDGDISADVLAVIQAAYIKQPELLNGLRLSVRKPGERETGAAGTFQTITRIVTLFKGTGGVELPGTIRHELSHSLEQMMTAKQRKVVFDAWMKAFEKAIKTNTDQKAQAYFEAVIAYISDPNEATFKAAAKLLPSRDLYQFISPSEYWAVNAEPLMRQQLGSAWDRFKMAVRRLFEGLKAVFGFDNTYYVHKVFAQVMGGSKERLDRKSIDASLISSIGISFDTLRDLDDVQDLIDKYNRPKTPMIDQTPVKTFLVKQKEASKEFIQEAVQDPAGAINTLFDGMNRQLLNARNKNVWYGTAINAADTLRYNNSLRTSNDLATSSLALDNAIRGGHISAEVVFLGGLEFNDNSLMYTAVKRDLGMVGVYKAEKEIKDRLGDQLGTDLIQGYLEAKRSRSIENEFIFRANELDEMTARLDLAREVLASARKRKDQELVEALEKEVLARNEDVKQARADLDAIEIARGKINMSEEEIDEFISMDVDHPELRDILKNFNAVNQNLLRVWREVGLLSQARYEALSNIKDYVPWNRIMSDEDDLHSPVQATTRSRANIAKEKLFKKGKPTVITSFTTKEGEQVYRIQPTSTLQVTLNGEVLSPELYDAEVNGKVTINVPLQDGDDLVFEGNREIENIIDNMTRSVMRMTMNAVSKYAANTIVREYATRDAEGKIRTYPKPEQERGRFYFIVNGRRVVVEIKDPLLAEAIFGMRNVDLAMIKPLQAAANMTRRFITTDPMFQLFQLFKDAPLAGLISGVKNPFIVYANVFASFAKALVSPTVVAATKKLPGGPIEVAETMRILRAAGIGGYYQQSRTAEAEVKRRIGIMNNNVLSWVGKALDHIGDASDYAQRMAIYDRIMSETGDEALALYQAANVLNFLRHGSGQIAQILVKTVPFANAYANSTDVLFQAMAGGGLKGRSRKASIALFFSYGSLLAATTLLYVMLVGDDEEYLKLDDQTKLRHYIIPGTDIKLPMNTSAAFFFKALPEALYNAYINAATKDETDAKRLRTALKEAAADMLLGPEPVPSALKPAIEIGLNRNFFTGRNVVPKNLEDVEAAEQYLGTTSEAGKFLSSLTGTDKTRLLNPIEADHIIRGLFGSVGAMAQWASNVLTDAAEAKPTPEKKDLPMVGRLFLPEVARGHEEWFYNFKKDVDKVWNTYQLKVKREKYDEAEAYLEQNEETLKYHATVMMLSEQLQKINASIKYFETSVDKDLKPDERREEINEAKRLKQEVLEDIARIRKDHELEVEEAEKERKKAK